MVFYSVSEGNHPCVGSAKGRIGFDGTAAKLDDVISKIASQHAISLLRYHVILRREQDRHVLTSSDAIPNYTRVQVCVKERTAEEVSASHNQDQKLLEDLSEDLHAPKSDTLEEDLKALQESQLSSDALREQIRRERKELKEVDRAPKPDPDEDDDVVEITPPRKRPRV